jgi:hypothetical protein
MIARVKEDPGIASARALLVGREVRSVCFVRDWVELALDDDVRVAAFTAPRGAWAARPWAYPTDVRSMLNYINQTVVDFQLDEHSSAELTFSHEHTFVIPLDENTRGGPEALHVIGPSVAEGTREMWVW